MEKMIMSWRTVEKVYTFTAEDIEELLLGQVGDISGATVTGDFETSGYGEVKGYKITVKTTEIIEGGK